MSETVALPGAITTPGALPEAIPVREWLPWAVFAGVLALFLLYIVGLDQGATSLVRGHFRHELVHDGRHLFGFPCH